jgi:hypothetical protein
MGPTELNLYSLPPYRVRLRSMMRFALLQRHTLDLKANFETHFSLYRFKVETRRFQALGQRAQPPTSSNSAQRGLPYSSINRPAASLSAYSNCGSSVERYKLHSKTQTLKPVSHFTSRVETRRFQAMGILNSTCTAPQRDQPPTLGRSVRRPALYSVHASRNVRRSAVTFSGVTSPYCSGTSCI